jgi:isopenicillin N synthase-like dioxygenase
MDAVPTIDLAGLGRSAETDQRIALEIGQAARGIGFFCVTGHGVPESLVSGMFDAMRAFFARPMAEKQALSIRHSPHNRGYVGLSEEALDPAKGADFKEAFNIGLDLPADHPEVLAGKPFRGVNLWPPDAAFRETTLGYFNAVWRLGVRMHRPIAFDLGLTPDWFETSLDAPLATLRLLRYPPAAAGADTSGAGEHTDYGNITILMTDDAGGLEVKTRDGRWIAVPHVPDAFIINIGDCLMRWTNNIYVSTPHRVTHRLPRERLSLAFFLDPNPDAVIAALPSCISENNPARYAGTTGAAYLKERLDATYAHRARADHIA